MRMVRKYILGDNCTSLAKRHGARETAVVSVRLPVELVRAIAEAADEQGESLSVITELAIRRGMNAGGGNLLCGSVCRTASTEARVHVQAQEALDG